MNVFVELSYWKFFEQLFLVLLRMMSQWKWWIAFKFMESLVLCNKYREWILDIVDWTKCNQQTLLTVTKY